MANYVLLGYYQMVVGEERNLMDWSKGILSTHKHTHTHTQKSCYYRCGI